MKKLKTLSVLFLLAIVSYHTHAVVSGDQRHAPLTNTALLSGLNKQKQSNAQTQGQLEAAIKQLTAQVLAAKETLEQQQTAHKARIQKLTQAFRAQLSHQETAHTEALERQKRQFEEEKAIFAKRQKEQLEEQRDSLTVQLTQSHARALEQQKEDFSQQLSALRAQISEQAAEIAAQKEVLDQERQTHQEALQKKTSTYEDEIAALTAKQASLQTQLKTALDEKAHYRKELTQARATNAATEKELRATKTHLEQEQETTGVLNAHLNWKKQVESTAKAAHTEFTEQGGTMKSLADAFTPYLDAYLETLAKLPTSLSQSSDEESAITIQEEQLSHIKEEILSLLFAASPVIDDANNMMALNLMHQIAQTTTILNQTFSSSSSEEKKESDTSSLTPSQKALQEKIKATTVEITSKEDDEPHTLSSSSHSEHTKKNGTLLEEGEGTLVTPSPSSLTPSEKALKKQLLEKTKKGSSKNSLAESDSSDESSGLPSLNNLIGGQLPQEESQQPSSQPGIGGLSASDLNEKNQAFTTPARQERVALWRQTFDEDGNNSF